MYEVRDEEEGGKWFLLIITLSLQIPLEKKIIKSTQLKELWQYLDHLESLWVITQKLLATAF